MTTDDIAWHRMGSGNASEWLIMELTLHCTTLYTVLYCAVLCCTDHAMSYRDLCFRTVQCSVTTNESTITVQCSTVQHSAVWYRTLKCNTTQYGVRQDRTGGYIAVHHNKGQCSLLHPYCIALHPGACTTGYLDGEERLDDGVMDASPHGADVVPSGHEIIVEKGKVALVASAT